MHQKSAPRSPKTPRAGAPPLHSGTAAVLQQPLATAASAATSKAWITGAEEAPPPPQKQERVLSNSFSEADFVEVFKQSRDLFATLHGWEYTAKVEGCHVYRKREPGQQLYTYRGAGRYEQIDPKGFHDVYMDVSYATEVSQFTKEAGIFRDDGAARLVVKFPFPLADREYRIYRESRMFRLSDGRRAWIIMMRPSVELPDDPPVKRGRILCMNNFQAMVLEEDPERPDAPMLYIHFFDDPGGGIPACTYDMTDESF
jgi:hypothetical protein